MFIKNFLIRTTDRFFCILGAICFSQIPNFIIQYQIRLSGHAEELEYQLGEIQKIALGSHLTLTQYIDKFFNNPDRDYHSQGIYLQNIQNRYLSFSSHLEGLKESSIFYKPFYLIGHLDFSIAWATLKEFSTSLPLTFEGLCYILLGLFFGASIFWLIRRIFAKLKLNKDTQYERKIS